MKRRDFLTAVAAVGASSLLKAEAESPQQIATTPKHKYSKPIINTHLHWYAPEFVSLIEAEGAANGVTDIRRNAKGELEATVPGYHPDIPRNVFRHELIDADALLQRMDERNVDMCTLSQSSPHVLWAPPVFGLKLAQAINDGSSKLCAKYPKRFTTALSLPMQDIPASLYELERARKLPGTRAVNIPENILGRNLSDKDFWPLYEAIEAANLPIFLHNVDPVSERLVEHDYNMISTIGNPHEGTIASSCLVLGGVLDQFPKLEIVLPHPCGYFPFDSVRMDWIMGTAAYYPYGRTKVFKNLKLPRASDYVRRFYYDINMHSPKISRMLIDMVGADRVLSVVDFSVDGVVRPVEYIEAIPNITDQEREMILCDTPARVLKL